MAPILMDPGQLAARLKLEHPVDTADGQGGATTAYASASFVWGRIEPVSVETLERAETQVFTITHRIWLRYRSDLTLGMRLRLGARIFVLRAFYDPDETRRFVVCRCEENSR